jgi:hypothetical protein
MSDRGRVCDVAWVLVISSQDRETVETKKLLQVTCGVKHHDSGKMFFDTIEQDPPVFVTRTVNIIDAGFFKQPVHEVQIAPFIYASM